MNADSPQGKEILLTHNTLKTTIIEAFQENPYRLAAEMERLTYVTLRRFNLIREWPFFEVDQDDLD